MGIRFEAFRYLVAVDHYHRFDYIQLQSFWTLAKLPIGTVYVIFTGLGTAGTVLVEILLFGEQANPVKPLIGMLVRGARTQTGHEGYG